MVLMTVLLLAADDGQARDREFIHRHNGYVYYEDTAFDLAKAIGVPRSQYPTITEEDNSLGYDTHGRVVSIRVYNDRTGEPLGEYPVVYLGDKVFINGVYAGTYWPVVDSGSTADKPSGEVTSEETTRQASRITKRLVGKRVASVLAPRPKTTIMEPKGGVSYRLPESCTKTASFMHTGLAAGGDSLGLGVWANGALTFLGNSSSSAKHHGTVAATMLGIDYLINHRVLAGVGVGYDHTWLNTDFNDGEFSGHGITIAPYVGISILDSLILDVTGAVSFVSNKGKRSKDFLDVSGDYQSVRTMLGTTLNYYHYLENWSFNAHAGFMYANEYAERYTEKGRFGYRNRVPGEDTYVGEWGFGGRVGYLFESWEPFVGLTYLWAPWMSGPGSLDNDELEGTIGVNFYPSDVFTVSLEVSNSFLRKHTRNTSVMCTVRYMF